MREALTEENCPLKMLMRREDIILSNLPTLSDLDDLVRQYRAASELEQPGLRTALFFKFSPFLLKALSWYCHASNGCGVNCRVGDLLSSSYIAFTHLIDDFDFDRHLNFLGYVVNGLSWGIFNSYMKERRYNKQRILLSTGATILKKSTEVDTEEQWLSAVEMEELLSILSPAIRNLFLLHFLFGYSLADLATLFNTKEKTLQKTIERARKKIIGEFVGNR
jgi:RNA polymerase sigma factor (sigma-70 family)